MISQQRFDIALSCLDGDLCIAASRHVAGDAAFGRQGPGFSVLHIRAGILLVTGAAVLREGGSSITLILVGIVTQCAGEAAALLKTAALHQSCQLVGRMRVCVAFGLCGKVQLQPLLQRFTGAIAKQ